MGEIMATTAPATYRNLKLERSGATRDPMKAQQAMSRLTAAERQAYLDAAGEQGAMPQAMNRAQRRAQEKLKKRR